MHEQMIQVVVNGISRQGRAEPRRTLADFLREDLGLTGTHVGGQYGHAARARCSSTESQPTRV